MTKFKNLSTTKKIILALVCIASILAILIICTVLFINTSVKNSSIGRDNAMNFALADANIDPASVQSSRTELEFEQGHFVYEVEFIADGTEYDYWIKASDGSVVKKQMEIVSPGETPAAITEDTTPGKDTAAGSNTTAGSNAASGGTNGTVTAEDAKKIALEDAKVSATDAVFTKNRLDYDDGMKVYEIEFYTDSAEYEYEIDAATGAVRSRDSEAHRASGTAGTGNSGSYIGIEKAKSIAVSQMGFSLSDVNFSKAKLDSDDGYIVYEIEFYRDNQEYEYTIDAVTGKILEHSASHAFDD